MNFLGAFVKYDKPFKDRVSINFYHPEITAAKHVQRESLCQHMMLPIYDINIPYINTTSADDESTW